MSLFILILSTIVVCADDTSLIFTRPLFFSHPQVNEGKWIDWWRQTSQPLGLHHPYANYIIKYAKNYNTANVGGWCNESLE